jgi:hypothetical protein
MLNDVGTESARDAAESAARRRMGPAVPGRRSAAPGASAARPSLLGRSPTAASLCAAFLAAATFGTQNGVAEPASPGAASTAHATTPAGPAEPAVQSSRIDIMLAPPMSRNELDAVLVRLDIPPDDQAAQEIVQAYLDQVAKDLPAAELLANEVAAILAAGEDQHQDSAALATADAFRQRAAIDEAFALADDRFVDAVGQLAIGRGGVDSRLVERIRYERFLRRTAAVYAIQPEAQVDFLVIVDAFIEGTNLGPAVLDAPIVRDRIDALRRARIDDERVRTAQRLRLIETYLEVARTTTDFADQRYIEAVRSAGAAENAVVALHRRAVAEVSTAIVGAMEALGPAAFDPDPTRADGDASSAGAKERNSRSTRRDARSDRVLTITAAEVPGVLQRLYGDFAYSRSVPRDALGAVEGLRSAAAANGLSEAHRAMLLERAADLEQASIPYIDRARSLVAESTRELASTMQVGDAQLKRDEKQADNTEALARLAFATVDAALGRLEGDREAAKAEERPALDLAVTLARRTRDVVGTRLFSFPGGEAARQRLAAIVSAGRTDQGATVR